MTTRRAWRLHSSGRATFATEGGWLTARRFMEPILYGYRGASMGRELYTIKEEVPPSDLERLNRFPDREHHVEMIPVLPGCQLDTLIRTKGWWP